MANKGMESLRELYKIGSGPSSSHTMGPEKAAKLFKERFYGLADSFRVILYGSLAKTGKGHCTDTVIKKTLAPFGCEIVFNDTETELPHPNTMELFALSGGKEIGYEKVFSIGGGMIRSEGRTVSPPEKIYPHDTFAEIAAYCREKEIRIWEYAEIFEGIGFWDYMEEIWATMKSSVRRGLTDEGTLPGGLEVRKKAKHLLNLEHIDETAETRENRMVSSYAFAVSEQNACGGTIVTAPTCGASGVVPAVLYYQQKKRSFGDDAVLKALAAGGIIGNLIKTNASISGAECGCQAEIGTACAMAAASLAELFQLSLDKIEYAAEVSIEHHLGLTCDPICGLVQVPCIERNAVAAMRAMNACNLAYFLSDTQRISFDMVVKTMYETGISMNQRFRETSEGGLARMFNRRHNEQ